MESEKEEQLEKHGENILDQDLQNPDQVKKNMGLKKTNIQTIRLFQQCPERNLQERANDKVTEWLLILSREAGEA